MLERQFFYIIFVILILQRIAELFIANKNAKHIKSMGGFEAAPEHYKYIVLLHAAFFISLFVEVVYLDKPLFTWWKITFLIFILVQFLRVWCIMSLGRFWNTRIYILPSSKPVQKGPYKYIRHPNYFVVIIELAVIPLTFGAYYTALLISIANLFLLSIRINAEEKALSALTRYKENMGNTPRFLFGRIFNKNV